jgi:hypothetical protein
VFRTDRTEEIPTVPLEVKEYRDLPIGLETWCREELDTRRDHSLVGRLEIINSQEQSDPASEPFADDPGLTVAVSACEENTGRTPARSNDNPAPALTR